MDIGASSAIQQARWVARGELSAQELVAFYLERIARLNTRYCAFVHIDADAALAAAAAIDQRVARGESVGVLAGVPFGVKDNANVAGMATTGGSRAFGRAPQRADDPIVARLRAADAIPLGKTNMPELGMHSATYNEAYGVSRNPWRLDRTPGGSSGGSAAAVSAGLVSFATGSDGGGSIRTPAAFCGLVGMKPSTALIPRANGDGQLSALGFLTRTTLETARLLDVAGGAYPGDRASITLGGPSFEDALAAPVARVRIAWSEDLGYAPIDPEVAAIALAAFEQLVIAVGLLRINVTPSLPNVYHDWVSDQLNFAARELAGQGVDISKLDQRTQRLLREHARADVAKHLRVRAAYAELEKRAALLFSEIDVLATPATACAAFGAEDEIPHTIAGRDAEWTGAEPLSMFANVLGAPAISIPAGLTRDGLPVGLQLVGRRCEDKALLSLARTLEQARPWALSAPGA
jgi:Asp-tRNA(Asn)/Glu-tRNA(Gln) amidotransferase A subunit family amidase